MSDVKRSNKDRKCPYCNKWFDHTTEPFEKYGRRYVHQACYSAYLKQQEKKDKLKNRRVCLFCNEDIDIRSEKYTLVGNRYAHTSCYKEGASEEIEAINALYDYLAKEICIKVDYMKMKSQRKNFLKQNKSATDEGILNTLKYFYGIQKAPATKAQGGIGIVPYLYEEAQEYYKNVDKKKEEIKNGIEKQLDLDKVIVRITKPEKQKEKEYIDLDSIGG